MSLLRQGWVTLDVYESKGAGRKNILNTYYVPSTFTDTVSINPLNTSKRKCDFLHCIVEETEAEKYKGFSTISQSN